MVESKDTTKEFEVLLFYIYTKLEKLDALES